MKTTVYIKAEEYTAVEQLCVKMKDICSIYCTDQTIQNQLECTEVMHYKKGEESKKRYVSVLFLVKLIKQSYPDVEVENLGKEDFIVIYSPERAKEKMGVKLVKILLICLVCFFGAGISVMGYTNDIGLSTVFGQIYELFTGTRASGPTLIEFFYSIGLTIGVWTFFHHGSKRKQDGNPTPIQIQMEKYEQDINQTSLKIASRLGEEEE